MKITINRSDAIGDLVLTLPLIKLFKERYPDSFVTLIVSPRVKGLVTTGTVIDEIKEIDFKRSSIKNLFLFVRNFISNRPDIYLHVGGSFIPTIAAWLARVPKRGGLKSKPLSFLTLNVGLRQKRSIVEMHESEYNMDLLKPFGIEYNYNKLENYVPEISLTKENVDESIDALNQNLSENGLTPYKPYIVVHPSLTNKTLNWSPRNYARVILSLIKKYDDKYNYLISYTPSDNNVISVVKDELKDFLSTKNKSVLFFDGSKRGLVDYINILSNAKLYLGPSTGTMHIANILKTKVVTIFSPIKVQSVFRWGPILRNNITKVIVPQTVCGERFQCALESCPYFDCMSSIEVEDVTANCVELLGLE